LAALAELARSQSRILRVYLEVLALDSAVRETVATSALALGFRRNPAPRRYAQTLVLDLGREEGELFASFRGQARRNIREVTKRSFDVRPITDAGYADRIAALLRETMERTGGAYQVEDWPALIRFGNGHPDLSRIVGTFRQDTGGPESLVAFAWGGHHVENVEYLTSGSTRSGAGKTPLSYALVWDLIRWAKQTRARWFDFGGITEGGLASEDPRGGISDFKRAFCTNVATVGEEWLLEPRPLRAKVARAVSDAASWLSRRRRPAS
jgi:hypothetical protein